MGLIQSIVYAIERDVLKLSAEMAVRFALALEVTTDDLLIPPGKMELRTRNRAARFCGGWSRSKPCPERSRLPCSRPSTTPWNCTCSKRERARNEVPDPKPFHKTNGICEANRIRRGVPDSKCIALAQLEA
jgi:hypothetical protein